MARKMVLAADGQAGSCSRSDTVMPCSGIVPAGWMHAVPALRDGAHLAVLEGIAARRKASVVYPPEGQVFNALHLTSLTDVRVVIVGQDPYHGPGQAHGLAFSVPEAAIAGGAKMPPSLRNIFKEIDAELHGGTVREVSPDLTRWARQGVLLLNTTLTVEAGKAASHATLGWSAVTDSIIRTVSEQCGNVVFLLWGSHAQQKGAMVDGTRHLVLESVHPSPLSAYRGFFGCNHFVRTNAWLREHGRGEVEW